MTENYKRYFKKDQSGREVFDYRAYEDDEQMAELARIEQKRKLASGGLKRCFRRLFDRQKTL